MDATVARLRAIGANATRVQHALAPALMERLDRAGIMVWQQLGPVDRPGRFAAGTDAALRARASSQVRQALRAGALHPAIVGWSLGTEVAGAGAPGQASWVAATARELHRRDPGRPVGVDVWKDLLPVAPGELYRELDAIGTTSYFGWYERTGVAPRAAARALRRRLARFRERLPGRLLLVAELGAEGTPDAARRALGGTGYQAALVGTQLRALARTPTSTAPSSGSCATSP
jgi:beta-galactosidase/beta-glucuronidase